MKHTYIGYIYKDIVNYFKFKKTIKLEESKTDSVYNEYSLSHNKGYTKIGYILTLPDECAQLSEQDRYYFIIDKMAPVVKYFDEELLFNDYIVINEPDAFLQVDDNGNTTPTLSYYVEFEFEFKKISWGLLFKTIILSTTLYYAYTLFA